MIVTKEVAKEEYNKLPAVYKKQVAHIMIQTKQQYIMSRINVDVPYFFWSLNTPIFKNDEYVAFLEIEDSYTFAVNAIYLISRYFNEELNK